MSFRLLLPAQLYRDMIAQAYAELPNECCGILAGHLGAGVGRVEKRYPLVNAAASPRAYLSDDASMLAAYKDWRDGGLEVLAIYHSHPDGAPVPSRTDLAQNMYGPDVIDLIIGLRDSDVSVRAWRLTSDAYCEAAWEVV